MTYFFLLILKRGRGLDSDPSIAKIYFVLGAKHMMGRSSVMPNVKLNVVKEKTLL